MSRPGWVFAAALLLAVNGVALLVPLHQLGKVEAIAEVAQKELLAGNYVCGDATACKKCVPAGGGCGTCVHPVGVYFCALYFPPYGHAGCLNAAAIKHCVFACTGTCPAKPGGSAACGNFYTLNGIFGCACSATAPCAATLCTDSKGTGQGCFECM